MQQIRDVVEAVAWPWHAMAITWRVVTPVSEAPVAMSARFILNIAWIIDIIYVERIGCWKYNVVSCTIM